MDDMVYEPPVVSVGLAQTFALPPCHNSPDCSGAAAFYYPAPISLTAANQQAFTFVGLSGLVTPTEKRTIRFGRIIALEPATAKYTCNMS